MDIRRAKGCSAESGVLVLVLYWLSVCLIDRWCCLVQVLNAFAGESCSLFGDYRSFLLYIYICLIHLVSVKEQNIISVNGCIHQSLSKIMT